ncbi:MAG: thioredoxin family protein [Verrucomicrobia bacterium]|nr:thioredoxin family protein [Verrucomicrobiota bacterium]
MLNISAMSMPPKPPMNADEREWNWWHGPCVGLPSVPLPMSVYPMAHVIEAIPTLLLFKDGQLIRTFVGVQSEAALTGAILAAAENPVIHPSSAP